MSRKKTRVDVSDALQDNEAAFEATPVVEINAEELDKMTAARIAGLHLERIFKDYDVGEVELTMQFFQLLHRRKYALNPDMTETARLDFESQLKLVFDHSA